MTQGREAAAAGGGSLRERLQALCDGTLALREETPEDYPFAEALYAEMRADELAPVPWPEEAKRAFLNQQSAMQRDHYRAHYPGAEFLLVEHDGAPAGRFYARVGDSEIRLMDIAVTRALRRRGIGGQLVRALMRIADAGGHEISLHVEPDNPIHPFYRRCGFAFAEDRGAYHFLVRPPAIS